MRGKTPWHVRRNYEPKRMNELPYRRPEGDERAGRVADLVRELAANRQALLPHRPFVRDLGRIVKDPWKIGSLAAGDVAFVADLPPSETVSVRLDPELVVVGSPRGRPRRTTPSVLSLSRGGVETGRVEGSAQRLDLLEALLGQGPVDELLSIVLPKRIEAYNALRDDRLRTVQSLLEDGRRLVEQVERIVCALYALPGELTEAVVEHAAARASRVD